MSVLRQLVEAAMRGTAVGRIKGSTCGWVAGGPRCLRRTIPEPAMERGERGHGDHKRCDTVDVTCP